MCPDCEVDKHKYTTPVAMPVTHVKTLADFVDVLKKRDAVNHPEHYAGKVECIDAIESAIQGLSGMEAMCTGNAIKYLYRWKKKNGVEDLKKAKWYIERLLNGLDAK